MNEQSERDKVFIDLETSGLDPYIAGKSDYGNPILIPHHEILEIGAIRTKPDLTPIMRMNRKVQPQRIHTGSQRAFELNGYTSERWASAVSLAQALAEFFELATDACLYAWNMKFDAAFLRMAHMVAGVNDTTHYHWLCVMSQYERHAGNTDSLADACVALDIEPEPDVHRAINGAEKALEVYTKIRERIGATHE